MKKKIVAFGLIAGMLMTTAGCGNKYVTLGDYKNLKVEYSCEQTEVANEDISAKIANLCRDEKLFGYALRISQCLESLDLGFVDKIIESEVFSRHEILFAYENSLMWLSSFIEYTTTKRY